MGAGLVGGTALAWIGQKRKKRKGSGDDCPHWIQNLNTASTQRRWECDNVVIATTMMAAKTVDYCQWSTSLTGRRCSALGLQQRQAGAYAAKERGSQSTLGLFCCHGEQYWYDPRFWYPFYTRSYTRTQEHICRHKYIHARPCWRETKTVMAVVLEVGSICDRPPFITLFFLFHFASPGQSWRGISKRPQSRLWRTNFFERANNNPT